MKKLLPLFLLACVSVSLIACGKKGSPHAPGPSNRITYPQVYPQPD